MDQKVDQTGQGLPHFPEDAPFSGDQKAWLGGFLAGLNSQLAMVKGAAPVEVAAKPLDILFGTQTGTAEALAEDAAELARTKGYAPRVAELDEIEMDQLATMEDVLIVVSTYGEGEMPDNAELFWDALTASTAPRLESLNFGVLALGDTSYEHFCQAGKLLDTRLEQLGAKRMLARVDCDVDYEDAAEAWIAEAIPEAAPGAAVAVEAAPKRAAKSQWKDRKSVV